MLVYVANKNCHVQKIVRVVETTHKIGNYFDVIRKSQSPIFCCHIKNSLVDLAYTSKSLNKK